MRVDLSSLLGTIEILTYTKRGRRSSSFVRPVVVRVPSIIKGASSFRSNFVDVCVLFYRSTHLTNKERSDSVVPSWL